MKRRHFITTGMGAAVLGPSLLRGHQDNSAGEIYEQIDKILNLPVIKTELFSKPVIIDNIELLRNSDTYVVHVRSGDTRGSAVSHSSKMTYLYPILLTQVAPVFIGKDARNLDNLLEEVYLYDSNYKMQGQAFWICVASVEFAILDLLGKLTGLSVGNLVGQVRRDKIAVYRANNYRTKTAEESIDLIRENIKKTGARAVKYKIGGRMSADRDSLPGRTEELIMLARKTLGDQITLYADANGSYTPSEAIRIGRLLEETNVSFFEEPCPFDYYEETKSVADRLTLPIAGGEQESSLRRFRWLIGSGCLQVVQPDLFYFGGMIRSVKVARMAETAGIPCTPHISGGGMGHLYMVHFASCINDPGPFQEFKGVTDIPFECASSSLESEGGYVTVPTEAGWGITLDPDFLKQMKVVKL